MGKHADDMIDGTTCSWCGQYFQHPDNIKQVYTHGYPVICKECYEGDKKAANKSGINKAIVDTL